MSHRSLLVIGAVVAALALGATIWILTAELTKEKTLAGEGLIPAPAETGGPFDLIGHDGQPITQDDLKGKLTLLYFGYTFCPDFCPAALQTFSAALDQLGEDAGEVQSFFISVDPERDTPEALADYVAHFHERTRAASGPKDKIDAVARAFRVYYALRKDVDPVDYPVDHSTFGYLMDRDWKLVAVIRHDASPEAIAAAVRQIL